jgi:hypothetical protein
MNTDIIANLETQLATAKLAATPVLTETLSESADERSVRITHGNNVTVRTAFLGGESAQYHETPQVKPEVHLFDKPVSKEIGRVLKTNSEEREIKLVSGTIRTDLR